MNVYTSLITIGCVVVNWLNGVVDVAQNIVGTVVGNGSMVVISVVGFAVDTEQHIMVTWSSRLV